MRNKSIVLVRGDTLAGAEAPASRMQCKTSLGDIGCHRPLAAECASTDPKLFLGPLSLEATEHGNSADQDNEPVSTLDGYTWSH